MLKYTLYAISLLYIGTGCYHLVFGGQNFDGSLQDIAMGLLVFAACIQIDEQLPPESDVSNERK